MAMLFNYNVNIAFIAIWIGGSALFLGLYGLFKGALNIWERVTGTPVEDHFPDWEKL